MKNFCYANSFNKILDCISLQKHTGQRQERRLEALRAYNTYKEEFFLPGVNKINVWKKMAETVREKCSLTRGDYDLQHFHSQILSLKNEYKRKRYLKSYTNSPYEDMFLKEAQFAFEDDSEFSGKFCHNVLI